MKEASAGNDAVTIANATGRTLAIIVALGGAVFLAYSPPFDRQGFPHAPWPGPVVVAYLVVIALATAWLLYRGCRLGVRFDHHGVTVRRILRTERYSWPEVSHFEDGYTQSQGGPEWALNIVLSDGHTVTVTPFKWGFSARPKTLATIERVAVRYQIPAELTGKA